VYDSPVCVQYFLNLQAKYIEQLLNIHKSNEKAQQFLTFSSPDKVDDEVFIRLHILML
jgi:hypothetical protein